MTRNDWFLNWDIIDPYPGCKWKPPWHCSWQPVQVLLGRWEKMCGKMKAICLDAATSSVCCVSCKQLNLSICDEPWTVVRCAAPVEGPQPPGSKAYRPLPALFIPTSHFEDSTAYICTDQSKITSSKGCWTLDPQITEAESHTWLEVCAQLIISCIRETEHMPLLSHQGHKGNSSFTHAIT